MAGMIGESIDGLVCDLDGVIYRGPEPIPGASDAIKRLRERGVHLLFCTNNSLPTIAEYIERLKGFGIDATPEELLTSGMVAAEVLEKRNFSGKTAIVVGGNGLREALGSVCISVKDDPDVNAADVVVVGWDPTFTYNAMRRAADAVRKGAAFLATNGDPSFPAPDGLWPGAGAILASIETASGRKAEVVGKPHPPMMEAAARRLAGCERIAVIGDRPDTDLAGGAARGWITILVLTGVTSDEDVGSVDPVPDHVLDSIAEIL
jgi:4-nitrophenyl phosphatase